MRGHIGGCMAKTCPWTKGRMLVMLGCVGRPRGGPRLEEKKMEMEMAMGSKWWVTLGRAYLVGRFAQRNYRGSLAMLAISRHQERDQLRVQG